MLVTSLCPFNRLPHGPGFLKTLWEKEKILVTSNVFYAPPPPPPPKKKKKKKNNNNKKKKINKKSAFESLILPSANPFNVNRSKILSFGIDLIPGFLH